MKAVQVIGDKSDATITVTDSVPKPSPTGDSVLVKVLASGITADEISWPELYETETRIPGHDISGVIEALGPAYTGDLSVGDSVFAMLPANASMGGQAEYTLASPTDIAPKAKSISHDQAAALPIPVLTAWEALFTHAKLAKGAKILVTGASGAVGAWVVQLANKLLDAEVTALASPRKSDYVKSLGAHQVIDYNSPDWDKVVQQVDAVIDTVGTSTLTRSWNTVQDNGTIVTVGDPPPPWAFGQGKPAELASHPNVKWIYFIVSPNGNVLSQVAALLDDNAVQPSPVETFPIESAVEAWKRAGERNKNGKAILTFGGK